jgi:hypothetical protein
VNIEKYSYLVEDPINLDHKPDEAKWSQMPFGTPDVTKNFFETQTPIILYTRFYFKSKSPATTSKIAQYLMTSCPGANDDLSYQNPLLSPFTLNPPDTRSQSTLI